MANIIVVQIGLYKKSENYLLEPLSLLFLMIPDVVAALPVLAHFSISVWSTHNVIHVDTDLLGLWRPARKRTYLGFIPFCVGSA